MSERQVTNNLEHSTGRQVNALNNAVVVVFHYVSFRKVPGVEYYNKHIFDGSVSAFERLN